MIRILLGHFVLMSSLLLVPTPVLGEEVRWIGDQTGPFGIEKTASGWSFYEGTMWSGFRPPGFIYDGGLQSAPGDIAIFDAQHNASAPDPQPYNMALGATVYFGDFAGRQNNSIQPIIYYEAQDVVNEQLIVRSGDWTFDFGPGKHGVGVGDPGPNHGSYTLTDRIGIGGDQVTATLTNGEVNANYVYIGSSSDIPALPDVAELNVVDATLITNGMGLFDVGLLGTNGVLNVTGDSLLQAGYMRVGENAGSIGRVRLSGSNVHAEVNGMQIGAAGSGELQIVSGASLHSLSGIAIANFGDSARGDVLVSGIGSALNIDTQFIVGDTGLGQLGITSGGAVTSLAVVVGNHHTSSGEVTVNGGPFGDDNLSTWQANHMVIGNDGSGEVLVTARGKIVSESALLGNTTNGVGGVTFTDSSTWQNSGVLSIGHGGRGTLDVRSHSTITSGEGLIGAQDGSVGEATISGSGTSWALGHDLTIGDSGDGSLIVENGATVSVPTDRAISVGRNLPGVGVMSITSGANLASGYASVGAAGEGNATVEGSGTSWTIDKILIVGASGVGRLDILDGAAVTQPNGFAVIGDAEFSEGNVLVDNSTWHPSHGLNVGWHGEGHLTIQNGASVTSTRGDVGNAATGNGSVVVRGHGSTWTSSDEVNIGLEGHGSLRIEDGADVVGTYFTTLGRAPTGDGEAVVTGDGSTWQHSSNFDVGASGHGTLAVEEHAGLTVSGRLLIGGGATGEGDVTFRAGASIATGETQIGRGTDASGNVIAKGNGTVWNNSGGFTIGHDGGRGELHISDEAHVTSDSMNVALAGGSGSLEVDGEGTRLDLVNGLHVALLGTFGGAAGANGEATISDGADVTSSWSTIGENEGSIGEVTVTGDGSTWTNSSDFGIGQGGHGALRVINGGEVSNRSTNLANGLAEVRGSGSQWNNTHEVTVRNGSLTAADDGAVTIGSLLRIESSGVVDVDDDGVINIGDGDAPSAGTLRVGQNGTLAGSGTIIGDVVVDGGSVVPGASPGALHIMGNYHQLPGGLLKMEIGGTAPGTEYDQLLVTGNLLLEAAVEVVFIDGFRPRIGQSFDLFGGSTVQLPGSLNFANAPTDFQYVSNFEGGVFSVTVTAVPEPTSLALVAAIAPLVWLKRRRQRVS